MRGGLPGKVPSLAWDRSCVGMEPASLTPSFPRRRTAVWNKVVAFLRPQTGIDPNLLAAMHMRENSGSRDPNGSGNIDGTSDIGPMQISQERWQNDVLP